MTARRTTLLVVLLALLAGLVAFATRDGSAGPGREGREGREASDISALRESIAKRAEGGDFYRPYTRLAEMLPNAHTTHSGQPGVSSAATDSVVLGRVSAVSEAVGFDETGQPGTADQPSATRVAFDDPAADWRTLRVTVAVEETLAGEPAGELVLDWALSGNSAKGDDAAAVSQDLRELGRIAVFSRALPDKPAYVGMRRTLPDPPLCLALVGADGALSFPFIPPTDSASSTAFMAGVDTVDELRSEAAKPTWSRRVG